jgi:hypothetical protein
MIISRSSMLHKVTGVKATGEGEQRQQRVGGNGPNKKEMSEGQSSCVELLSTSKVTELLVVKRPKVVEVTGSRLRIKLLYTGGC